MDYIDAEVIEREGTARLADASAILVPGGFGEGGIEGKILTAQYARENKVPYLGISLGLQVAVIEIARNLLGLADADSTEFNAATANPLVHQVNPEARPDSGKNMRLGGQVCKSG